MTLRLAKLRASTLDTLDVLAREHGRSRPDIAEALARVATSDEHKAAVAGMLVAQLAAMPPLQALRGTGRRAVKAAKREAEEEK